MNNYNVIQIEKALFIESNGSKMLIGESHRIYCEDAISPIYAKSIRERGANPADYFSCNGKPIRKSVRAEIESIVAKAKIEFALSTEGLRETRENLLHQIWACRSESADIRTRNFHKYDTGRGMGRNDFDSRIDLLTTELTAFDAAHPEIKSAIEAEKSASTERNLWN